MINESVFEEAAGKFKEHFGQDHTVVAYAPGRVEGLGNPTDYNEGFVLSAAINFGTFFIAAPAEGSECRLVAGDLMEEAVFDVAGTEPEREHMWANYVKGVFAGLRAQCPGELDEGFVGLFLGNIPLGAGLSSSAALEMTSALGLCELYGVEVDEHTLAKIGQAAEHNYAGVKCGLLDQISSLYGKANSLVMTDFRTLEVENVPLGDDACFLMCNTKAKHALVDGEYNERREKCEEAAGYFGAALDRQVAALRDVSWEEWQAHASKMEDHAARRSAHVIGECTRVLQGKDLLEHGSKLDAFGKLMFESHESSRKNFENSCEELDVLVDAARSIPGVLGARLSGGGFGGSVVVLVHPRDAEVVGQAMSAAYSKTYGHGCDVEVILPSDGARVI